MMTGRFYSYAWSEPYEADLFTRIRELGMLAATTGKMLDETILSRGNSADPKDLFRAFIGTRLGSAGNARAGRRDHDRVIVREF